MIIGSSAVHHAVISIDIIDASGVLRGKVRWQWFPLTWGSASLTVLPWARRFGGAGWSLLAPLGALLVQVAGVHGLVNRLLGRGVMWKDRRV